ncbi:hypothetical protein QTP86_029788, partial [Hemibagrus guttatus]
YSTKHIIKLAKDTTVVGLITNNSESNYRSEKRTSTAPTTNHQWCLRVNSTKFLGVLISEDLSWMMNTTSLAKLSHASTSFTN